MLGNPNFDGAAPGAQLVSARACTWGGGCTAAALSEGMIELVVNRGVDVVNMSIGGLPALNDANNARAVLYDTLINDFGVQMFISAGNSGPGINTMGDPSAATDVVSVAAAISKQTWLANYGSTVRKKYNLFNFSSRGPREDGGFKPNIAAPGSAISTIPLWQPGEAVPEAGYALPPGFAMFNGTSMSSPQAAGAATLLLSAAKATGKRVRPAELRRAIYSSATWIDGVPAHGQGNGRFEVNGAWKLLKGGVQARGYTADAPVCTPLSDFLATPGRGTGIYNRCAAASGGQRPGVAKTCEVKLTRTSGPAGAVSHALRLVGNDGAFKAPASVMLPLNTAVRVPVQAKAGVGVHSVSMEVDDPKTSTVDFEAECNPLERSYENPEPGIWEIEVESRRTSPLRANPFKLTARVQGVTVEPALLELPSVTAGQATPVTWTATNNFGPVKVAGQGGPLGSALSARPTIGHLEQQITEIVVPAGATRLDAVIGNTSDMAADLDLYVFLGDELVGMSADGDSEEAVSLLNPAPGTYQVFVDGFDVPAGTTQYDYRDVFYSPALGTLSVPSTVRTLAHGASVNVTGSVTALSAPAAGRQLFGEMLLVTTEGAVIGRGNVRIGAVT